MLDLLNLNKFLFKNINKNNKFYIGNQTGSNTSFTIANINQINNKSDRQFYFIITPDTKTARQLEQEIPLFLNNDIKTQIFPDWETLPYDHFSAHQDIISNRLEILSNLSSQESGILICPLNALMHPVPSIEYIAKHSLDLKVGQNLNLTQKRRELEKNGYLCVQNVLSSGEFAVRGSLLDIFPMGSKNPYRVDLFDDEIESIKSFDPETQRSLENITNIKLLPAREYPITDQSNKIFSDNFKNYFPKHANDQLIKSINEGKPIPGMEYYLPLFFGKKNNILDFIPENTQIILSERLNQIGEKLWQDIQNQYEQNKFSLSHPPLLPKDLFTPINNIFEKINNYPQINLQKLPLAKISSNAKNIEYKSLPDLKINPKLDCPQEKLKVFLHKCNDDNINIILCAQSPGRSEHLKAHLLNINLHAKEINNWQDFYKNNQNIKDNLAIMLAPIEQSIYLSDANLIFIAETDLFENFTPQRRIKSRAKNQQIVEESRELFADVSELEINEAIVHLEHGVGIYRGLETLNINGDNNDFLKITYKNDDILYVPINQINLISKYQALSSDVIPVNKLGTDKWSQTKEKALKKIRDVAAELLDIYAKRELKVGFAMTKNESNNNTDSEKFNDEFPFELTPDQARAIKETIDDLKAPKPMDRLLCGDVGFGKTEVAMRAAFLCVQNFKQVAILVPTTLLGQQHGERFEDRFANWPVSIEVISRFKSTKQQTLIKKKLESGQIDIIIGTHKLLSDDIKFKDLGLLIIDEEHRFGVSQKEKMKAMRTEVDILSMTATPIPRTLSMAFSHIREFSIIATPPAKRLNVKTFINEYDIRPIKEAITREVHRSGQVFYLHNDVKTIEIEAHRLSNALPDINFGIAHGQMRPAELEKVMADFYHHKFQVLICSTIIETGIDIPNANTIIINRADRLGLAQLHQLRGRVGRSHHQAYAYLLTPETQVLSSDAKKRLKAFESTESLSAGLTLATHDLEIRGAGELLGQQQSGQINGIGFHLYAELLDKTVKAMQSGRDPSLLESLSDPDCKIDISLSLIIPDSYLPDVNLRLKCYKQITHAKTHDQLDKIQINMIDRFGALPEPTQSLFASMHLKLNAKESGVIEIKGNLQQTSLSFIKDAPINLQKLVILVAQQPADYQMMPNDKVKVRFPELENIDNIKVIISKYFEKLDKFLKIIG